MKQTVSNWSSYRRKSVNISKAVENETVSKLLSANYQYLHNSLIKSKRDEDTFNDTYLKLTYNYNPDKDFIDQFKYYFNLLKGAYFRDDSVANYQLQIVDTFPDKYFKDTDDFELEQPVKKKTISMDDLKAKVQNYAISTKTSKRTSKKG